MNVIHPISRAQPHSRLRAGERIQFLMAIAIAGFVAQVSGCAVGGAVPPKIEWPASRPQLLIWLDAPTVVVGRVLAVTRGRSTKIERPGLAIRVQLEEVEIAVESVLRGDEPGPRIRPVRHAYVDGPAPGNLPIDFFKPDERRIFFLTRLGNRYRFFEDLVAASIPISTGRHQKPTLHLPLSKTIARLLIVPGEEVDDARFVRHLEVQAGSVLPFLVGIRDAAELLREAGRFRPGLITAYACFSIVTLKPFGDNCLTQMLGNTALPAAILAKANEVAASYGAGKARAAEEFKARPEEWMSAWVKSRAMLERPRQEVLDDADFILRDLAEQATDPALRRVAQAARGRVVWR